MFYVGQFEELRRPAPWYPVWSREGRAKSCTWNSRRPRPGPASRAAKSGMRADVFPGALGGGHQDLSSFPALRWCFVLLQFGQKRELGSGRGRGEGNRKTVELLSQRERERHHRQPG